MKMRGKLLTVFWILILPALALPAFAADMNDYCIVPPFIVGGIQPNLLLMLDNSASMYDPAYSADPLTRETYSCVDTTTGLTYTTDYSYCYDNTYDDTKFYEGYFDQDDTYSYSFVDEKFSGGALIPAPPCIPYGTSYLCVQMLGGSVTQFIARGNFLNWLSASKFDVQKKVLTGGKYDTANSLLLSESRGCVGRRFVKEVKNSLGDDLGITFAVRGPNALEPGYVDPDTQGGGTRIEIYETDYNNKECQCAIYNWSQGNYGQASNDTKGCIDAGGRNTESGRELSTFNHSLQTCWLIKDNIRKGATTEATIFQGVNTQDVETACTNIYEKDMAAPADPALITNKASGNYICTSAPTATHLAPAAPYDVLGSDTTGFIGKCWQGTADKFTGKKACVEAELLHYCMSADVAEVIDPSGGEGSSDTTNLPAVLIDAGVRAMGDPAGTFTVKVSEPVSPKGLIQDFHEIIRFGAMSFNFNGSATECNVSGSNISCPKICSLTTARTCRTNADCPAGETCTATVKNADNLDGGEIIHYIGSPIGDHTSNLIEAVDNLNASAWTPFAEGFYNSIGYFARTNTYDVTPGTSRGVDPVNGALRLNAGDYLNDKNPSEYRCQANNILIISDGMSSADRRSAVNDLVAKYNDGDGETTSAATPMTDAPKFAGSKNLDDLAWLARNRNIKTFSTTAASSDQPENLSEFIKTHVVYSGKPCEAQDADGNCTDTNESISERLMQQTAKNGDGRYTRVENPEDLYGALRKAFLQIAAGSASGTAASVLASGEGSGANLVQAVFYPSRRFGITDVEWTGVLQNLWYYIDPFLGNSSIREDTPNPRTAAGVGDKELRVKSDYIVNFFFDEEEHATMVNLYTDGNGDGVADSLFGTIPFEELKYLWEAGRKLFLKNPADRTIYTQNGTGLVNFPMTVNAGSPLIELLQASNENEATAITRYIRGTDLKVCSINKNICGTDADCTGAGETCEAYRRRTVTIDGVTNTWKLGDVINSTPRIESWVPLNLYDKAYYDTTYREFTLSDTYRTRGMVFSGANDGIFHAFRLGTLKIYQESDRKASLSDADMGEEAWAFIPMNALPYLKYLADENYCHLYYIDATPYLFDASFGIDNDTDDDGTNDQPAECTGTEYWKCKKSKDSWRTVIIGGMRFGGSCRNKDSATVCTECVKTPISKDNNGDGDSADDGEGVGYSSYFALDVTDPENPSLMWEFSDEGLGHSTSGPAIVRVGDPDKNGRWFVVFGSGPSGYISKPYNQFMGIAEHLNHGDIRLYVLDLKTGALARTISAGEYGAFAGSLVNSTIDFDKDYQDEALYFGYTVRSALGPTYTAQGGAANEIQLAATESAADDKYNGKFVHLNTGVHETKLIVDYDGATKTATVDSDWKYAIPNNITTYNILDGWTSGGVKRLLTKRDTNPANWAVSTLIQTTGPVTASVSRLQNYSDHTVRLYFGTGRYFYKVGEQIDESFLPKDGSGNDIPLRLYGVKEPCYSSTGIDNACTTTVSAGDLGNAANASGSADSDGWYIELDGCTNGSGAGVDCGGASAVYRPERVVTDTSVTLNGAVIFNTTKPSADICEYGGKTHLWAVKYDTGGALGASVLRGKAILQVSTGSIEEIDLRTAFSEKDGRRTSAVQGVPPAGSPPGLLVPPDPINRVIHLKEW